MLAKNARKVRRSRSLASWLYKVAHRIAIRQLKARIQCQAEQAIEPVAEEESPLERLARRSDEETVDDELRRMPDRYRGPLVLYYLEERSYQEIADELGITWSAAAGRIKRGRADLRRRLLRRGMTVSGFVMIVIRSQESIASADTESLVHNVVENAIAFADGDVAADLTSHQLAQLEHVHMMLPTTKIMSLSAVALLSIGLGLYGASSFVAAQTPEHGGQQVHVAAAQDSRNTIEAAFAVAATVRQSKAASPAARRRRAVERIEMVLDTETLDLTYAKQPLNLIIDDIRTRLGIPILMDTAALEDWGIGYDTPVSFNVKGISARSALRLCLKQLELTYVVADEVMLITTPEEAESRLTVRVYDTGSTGIASDKLAELITSTIEWDSWQAVGGPGKIAAATATRLVIAQTQEVHEAVSDLLYQLNRAEEGAK